MYLIKWRAILYTHIESNIQYITALLFFSRPFHIENLELIRFVGNFVADLNPNRENQDEIINGEF